MSSSNILLNVKLCKLNQIKKSGANGQLSLANNKTQDSNWVQDKDIYPHDSISVGKRPE